MKARGLRDGSTRAADGWPFVLPQILYGVGFSHDELVMYTPLVHYNCVEGMKALVEAAQELDLPLRDKVGWRPPSWGAA